jgi:exocyst complex component 6
VTKDDYQPMHVETPEERDAVLRTVWIPQIVEEELSQCVLPNYTYLKQHAKYIVSDRAAFPLNFPWSQSFYQCCQSASTIRLIFLFFHELTSVLQIDTFTQKFLQYVEGVHKGHRNVDEQLGKVSRTGCM